MNCCAGSRGVIPARFQDTQTWAGEMFILGHSPKMPGQRRRPFGRPFKTPPRPTANQSCPQNRARVLFYTLSSPHFNRGYGLPSAAPSRRSMAVFCRTPAPILGLCVPLRPPKRQRSIPTKEYNFFQLSQRHTVAIPPSNPQPVRVWLAGCLCLCKILPTSRAHREFQPYM